MQFLDICRLWCLHNSLQFLSSCMKPVCVNAMSEIFDGWAQNCISLFSFVFHVSVVVRTPLLVHSLLKEVGSRKGVRKQSSENVGRAQTERICYLERVSEIGLKRGRCHHCQITKRQPPRSTVFGCGVCSVRLCKTTCFAEFHNYNTKLLQNFYKITIILHVWTLCIRHLSLS